MNKTVFSIVIAVVAGIALVTASFVYAQAPTPQTPVPGSGYGMMGGERGARGGMMGQNMAPGTQDGLIHDEMIAVYAEKLDISVVDLDARLAKGETMSQIASSKGLTADQFTTLMADARSQAIDQAVKNGTLTQAQADWMKQRGAGMATGGRGMRGTGQGRNANADCPYYSPTQP